MLCASSSDPFGVVGEGSEVFEETWLVFEVFAFFDVERGVGVGEGVVVDSVVALDA